MSNDIEFFYESKKIPRRFLPVIESSDNLVFETTTIKRTVKLSRGKEKESIFLFKKKEQKAILDFLINKSDKDDDLIIGISSIPNDLLASQAVGLIVNGRLSRLGKVIGGNFIFVNFGIFSSFQEPFKWLSNLINTNDDTYFGAINLVIIYNISGNEDPKLVRGILDFLQGRLRIVVISGLHFFDFFDNYIKYPINGGMHIIGTKKPLNKFEFYLVKKYKSESTSNDKSIDFEIPAFLPSTSFIKEVRNFIKPKSIKE